MIYDVFPFTYEVDALAVRLAELRGVPDLVHVAVECTTTLRYEPRELLLPILELPVDVRWPRLITLDLPPGLDPKEAEWWLRRTLPTVADSLGCEPDDHVIVSDADEIPSADQLFLALLLPDVPCTLVTDYRELRADWRAPDEWQPIHQAFVARRGQILDAQKIRESGCSRRNTGGWHLSSMGGPANVARKLASFSHDELDTQFQDLLWLDYCERNGRDLLGRFDLEPVERKPDLLPDCILNDEKFKHLLRETKE